MTSEIIEEILDKKQLFFEPHYIMVINEHPEGIDSTELKAKVRSRLKKALGIDPFDPKLFGQTREGKSLSSQWASNLVSNRVIDANPDVIVVRREKKVRLFSRYVTSDTSMPIDSKSMWPSEDDIGNDDIVNTAPQQVFTGESSAWRRDPYLAERVRSQANYRCLLDGDDCCRFIGRNGLPYIEAHHVVPMAQQGATPFNLDCIENLVPLCIRCHRMLHAAHQTEASLILTQFLKAIESQHGQSFESLMSECHLPCSELALSKYY